MADQWHPNVFSISCDQSKSTFMFQHFTLRANEMFGNLTLFILHLLLLLHYWLLAEFMASSIQQRQTLKLSLLFYKTFWHLDQKVSKVPGHQTHHCSSWTKTLTGFEPCWGFSHRSRRGGRTSFHTTRWADVSHTRAPRTTRSCDSEAGSPAFQTSPEEQNVVSRFQSTHQYVSINLTNRSYPDQKVW